MLKDQISIPYQPTHWDPSPRFILIYLLDMLHLQHTIKSLLQITRLVSDIHFIIHTFFSFQDELADKYDVKGIPYLVIMDSQGTIIDKEGRGTVQTDCGTEIPGKWRKT